MFVPLCQEDKMKDILKKYVPYVSAALVGLVLYVCMRMFLFPNVGLTDELDAADMALPFASENDGFTVESITYDDSLNVQFHVGFSMEKLDNRFDDDSLKKFYADLHLNNVFCGMRLVKRIYEGKGNVSVSLHAYGRNESVTIPLKCVK